MGMQTLDLVVPPLAPRPRGIVAEVFRRDPLYAGAAATIALSMALVLVAWACDDRSLDGVAIWAKPLKFQMALAVYLATLAWFSAWMPPAVATARSYRIFATLVVTAVALELVWIVGAAAQGEASHFNVATPARRAIYATMGALATLLTSAALVQGIAILSARDGGGDPVLRLAIGLGLLLTFALTLATASNMSDGTGHLVGVAPDATRRLALFGWARDGGDLRVAHFFATHAMHALPASGLLAARLLSRRRARQAVVAGAVAYAAFVGWTFAQALAGRPFLPWLS